MDVNHAPAVATNVRCYVEGSGEDARLVCTRCGARLPMPLGAAAWVTGVLRAFEAGHRHCRPGEGYHTRLAGWEEKRP